MLSLDTAADRRRELGSTSLEHANSSLNAGTLTHDRSFMPTGLHHTLQTGLPSTKAKCFAMKSLADQVREFMDAQPDVKGRPFSKAAMASAVAAQQKELPLSERCKRQHIEALFAKNLRTTLYLVPLARAMGTTAEVLYSGRFEAAVTRHVASAPTPLTPSNPGIGYLATLVVEKMKLLKESQRETAGAALRSLALWPEEAQPQIEALVSMLGEFEAQVAQHKEAA